MTEAELARARAQVKASLLMSLESTGSRCEQLARQLQVFGRVVPTAETVAKINAVTTEDVLPRRRPLFRGAPDAGGDGPGRARAGAGEYRGEAGGLTLHVEGLGDNPLLQDDGWRQVAQRGSHRPSRQQPISIGWIKSPYLIRRWS